MILTLVRILGWLVIAHGLSHAVLPMRGSLAPLLYGDWMPVALFGVSTVGFVAAGLGRLRPQVAAMMRMSRSAASPSTRRASW